jgi:hypothetical protein
MAGRTGDNVSVALAIDAGPLPGWQRVFVDRLRADPAVELAAIIRHPPTRSGAVRRGAWTLVDAVEAAISRHFLARSLIRGAVKPAMLDTRPVDIGSLDGVAGLPVLRLADGPDREAGFDVIVDLTGRAWPDNLAGLARHDVWALLSDRGGHQDGTPLGFRAFYRNEPICTIRLVRADGSAAVASGSYSTYRWSWSLNAMLLAHRASLLVTDSLTRLGTSTPSIGAAGRAPDSPRDLAQAVLAPMMCVWRLMIGLLRRALFEDRWRVLVAEGTPDGRSLAPPIVLDPPAHSYWADPFVVRRGDRCWIFFEEYPYATHRGVISCMDIGGPGLRIPNPPPRARRVLDRPQHLSYPFLFSHRDALYMIPESNRSGTVELWKCTGFPDTWEKQRNMLEGVSAADSSLLHWNGKWWLFTNIDRTALHDHCSELHLFHCEDPVVGAWLPHTRNPVVVDVRRARMAGGFLTAPDGRPVRCCQVQGRRYGESVVYCLVEEISETTYVETPLDGFADIVGDKSARHHHVAYSDGLIVADECRRTLKLRRALPHLRSRAGHGGQIERS